MNAKQFKNMLEVWDEDFINAWSRGAAREALTSFLKRLQRANQRQELDVKKVSDRKTDAGRYVVFNEKRTGVIFEVDVNYLSGKVSLLY